VPELKPARLYRWTLLDTARSASSDDRCWSPSPRSGTGRPRSGLRGSVRP